MSANLTVYRRRNWAPWRGCGLTEKIKRMIYKISPEPGSAPQSTSWTHCCFWIDGAGDNRTHFYGRFSWHHLLAMFPLGTQVDGLSGWRLYLLCIHVFLNEASSSSFWERAVWFMLAPTTQWWRLHLLHGVLSLSSYGIRLQLVCRGAERANIWNILIPEINSCWPETSRESLVSSVSQHIEEIPHSQLCISYGQPQNHHRT